MRPRHSSVCEYLILAYYPHLKKFRAGAANVFFLFLLRPPTPHSPTVVRRRCVPQVPAAHPTHHKPVLRVGGMYPQVPG